MSYFDALMGFMQNAPGAAWMQMEEEPEKKEASKGMMMPIKMGYMSNKDYIRSMAEMTNMRLPFVSEPSGLPRGTSERVSRIPGINKLPKSDFNALVNALMPSTSVAGGMMGQAKQRQWLKEDYPSLYKQVFEPTRWEQERRRPRGLRWRLGRYA